MHSTLYEIIVCFVYHIENLFGVNLFASSSCWAIFVIIYMWKLFRDSNSHSFCFVYLMKLKTKKYYWQCDLISMDWSTERQLKTKDFYSEINCFKSDTSFSLSLYFSYLSQYKIKCELLWKLLLFVICGRWALHRQYNSNLLQLLYCWTIFWALKEFKRNL